MAPRGESLSPRASPYFCRFVFSCFFIGTAREYVFVFFFFKMCLISHIVKAMYVYVVSLCEDFCGIYLVWSLTSDGHTKKSGS